MKTIYIILIFSLALFSCDNNNTDLINNKSSFSVENPLTDLSWLKDLVTELEDSSVQHSITQAEYKGETVFVIGTCCLACNYVIPVHNCQGENIGIVGTAGENHIHPDEISNSKEIWKSKKECL